MSIEILDSTKNQQETLRAFFSIMFNSYQQQRISSIQQLFMKAMNHLSIRWSKPENLHITLRFIPKLRQTDIDPILAQLKPIIGQYQPFALQWNELRLFPSRDESKIIVYDLLPSDHLNQLVQAINNVLLSFGYPDADFPFSPHVTLAKLEEAITIKQFADLVKVEKASILLPDILVSEIDLINSHGGSAGSHYNSIGHLYLHE